MIKFYFQRVYTYASQIMWSYAYPIGSTFDYGICMSKGSIDRIANRLSFKDVYIYKNFCY